MIDFSQFEDKEYYTNKRLKICGNFIYYYQYGKSFKIGKRIFRPKNEIFDDNVKQYSEQEIRDRVLRRARRKISDLVNSNSYSWADESGFVFKPIFLTLTFEENVTDIEMANYEFTKFIQRFNYEITGQKGSYLKYVAVIEFQERGAIHYHAIIFNLPFIEKIYDKLKTIWTAGFFKISLIDKVKNVGFYLVKYMHKKLEDPRLKGHKCYFTSKNLKQPRVIYFEELINLILPMLPQETKEKEIENIRIDYLLTMDIIIYNLKEQPDIKQAVLDFINQYL